MTTFRLTGRHALFMFVLFFGVIIAANVAFTIAAVKSFPGEEEHKSYFQGLHYNETLAARAEQESLGWRAVLVEATIDEGGASFLLRISDRSGKPIDGLALDGAIRRTTHESEDASIEWLEAGAGAYRGFAAGARQGLWEFRAHAVGPDSEPFAMETRIVLK